MFFKVVALFMVVLSLTAAHRGGHFHHPHGQHMIELKEQQKKIESDVAYLLKAVKEGQLLEMTYDMWTRQQKINKKLNFLIAMFRGDKMDKKNKTVGMDKVTKIDKAKDEKKKLNLDKAQPPSSYLTRENIVVD